MSEIFYNFPKLIIFLHLLSAIIWIGGMIVIRFAVHYSMQRVEDPKLKLGISLENLRRFFNMVIPSIILLFVTAIIMILALDLKNTPLYTETLVKEGVLTLMSIIFVIIYQKRKKAQKFFDNGDFRSAKKNLLLLANYLIPLNIALGFVAIVLGIILRGY